MVKIQLFSSCIKIQLLIKCLNSKSEADYRSMWNTIWNLRGTPQEPVDWQSPDQSGIHTDLLIQNEIAVKSKKLKYFTVDNCYFAERVEKV